MSRPLHHKGFRPRSKPTDPVLNVLQTWLGGAAGAALGENHREREVPHFLARHARSLREMGVTTLFVEGVDHRDQDLLDHYCATGETTKEFPPRQGTRFSRCLDWSLNRWNLQGRDGLKDAYLVMYAAMRAAGIKLVAIDNEDTTAKTRLADSNPVWVKAIRQHICALGPRDKYLVHGGYFHFCDLSREENAGPHVATSLGISALFLTTEGAAGSTRLEEKASPASPDLTARVRPHTYTPRPDKTGPILKL
jgi:hypothetical protein